MLKEKIENLMPKVVKLKFSDFLFLNLLSLVAGIVVTMANIFASFFIIAVFIVICILRILPYMVTSKEVP